MKLLTQWISLSVSLIALVGASIGRRQARTNATELKTQRAEIEKLHGVASRVAPTFTIDTPREGEMIRTRVYNDMHGTYEGDIPPGYTLRVLARDPHNYFLMYPPMQVMRTMRRWSQTNIRLATPGRWELHVAMANEKASQWLEARAINHE